MAGCLDSDSCKHQATALMPVIGLNGTSFEQELASLLLSLFFLINNKLLKEESSWSNT